MVLKDEVGTVGPEPNLESILIKVNRFINIDRERERYAGHFSTLTNRLFKDLREDPVFKSLFNGLQLSGSYGDNVKVTSPDEFDMDFHIKFPESDLLIVRADKDLSGNVHIDFSRVLKKIEREKQHAHTFKQMLKWLTADTHLLLVESLQAFFQGCFVTVLRRWGHEIEVNGQRYSLRYRRCGPAHTIVVGGACSYSVDYVPAILLAEHQSVLSVGGPWAAIPKPPKLYAPQYTSFRASYYQQEGQLMKHNYNLKNVLRMLKKFRDSHQNMQNMKSYFIKTLFLWKAREKQHQKYWDQPLSVIVVEMFREMESSLAEERLRFYWEPQLNLFANLSSRQLVEMHQYVRNARQQLERAAHSLTPPLRSRVFCIFLTLEERQIAGVCCPRAADVVVASPEQSSTDSWCTIL